MFVTIKNNLQDATAVVAFTHIPPGQVRSVEQARYTKWCKGGGHRLLDAGMIEEVYTEAQAFASSAVSAPVNPVVEEVEKELDTSAVPESTTLTEPEQPDTAAAVSEPELATESGREAFSARRKRR